MPAGRNALSVLFEEPILHGGDAVGHEPCGQMVAAEEVREQQGGAIGSHLVGVGANGNISVGVSTVGGMLAGTWALLFVVPSLFIVFQYVQERFLPGRTPGA